MGSKDIADISNVEIGMLSKHEKSWNFTRKWGSQWKYEEILNK